MEPVLVEAGISPEALEKIRNKYFHADSKLEDIFNQQKLNEKQKLEREQQREQDILDELKNKEKQQQQAA